MSGGGGKGVGWVAVSGASGVFDSSPPPLWKPCAKCCPRPSETAQDGDQHLPPSLPPRAIGGLRGPWVRWTVPRIQTGRKDRAIPKGVWRAKVSVQVVAGKLMQPASNKKSPGASWLGRLS